MSERTLRNGHFYPLDLHAALDLGVAPRYLRACARRALREPTSARNAQRRRALGALSSRSRKALDVPP